MGNFNLGTVAKQSACRSSQFVAQSLTERNKDLSRYRGAMKILPPDGAIVSHPLVANSEDWYQAAFSAPRMRRAFGQW